MLSYRAKSNYFITLLGTHVWSRNYNSYNRRFNKERCVRAITYVWFCKVRKSKFKRAMSKQSKIVETQRAVRIIKASIHHEYSCHYHFACRFFSLFISLRSYFVFQMVSSSWKKLSCYKKKITIYFHVAHRFALIYKHKLLRDFLRKTGLSAPE